ncbi:mannosyltransferase, partial [Modicella reniformis]
MDDLEKLDRESLGYDKSQSFAIIIGLTFMVIFRLIGYLATKPPSVAALGKKGFCIIVLGDIGHSPRMLLHAKSSRLPEDLENHPSIQFYYLKELPRVPENMPRILYYLFAPIKAVFLAFQLFFVAMFDVAAPELY